MGIVFYLEYFSMFRPVGLSHVLPLFRSLALQTITILLFLPVIFSFSLTITLRTPGKEQKKTIHVSRKEAGRTRTEIVCRSGCLVTTHDDVLDGWQIRRGWNKRSKTQEDEFDLESLALKHCRLTPFHSNSE